MEEYLKLKMKHRYITLKISNASNAQMVTLASEMNVVAQNWRPFGPRIEVLKGKLKELKQFKKTPITKW